MSILVFFFYVHIYDSEKSKYTRGEVSFSKKRRVPSRGEPKIKKTIPPSEDQQFARKTTIYFKFTI